jgi:hypothetical protein
LPTIPGAYTPAQAGAFDTETLVADFSPLITTLNWTDYSVPDLTELLEEAFQDFLSFVVQALEDLVGTAFSAVEGFDEFILTVVGDAIGFPQLGPDSQIFFNDLNLGMSLIGQLLESFGAQLTGQGLLTDFIVFFDGFATTDYVNTAIQSAVSLVTGGLDAFLALLGLPLAGLVGLATFVNNVFTDASNAIANFETLLEAAGQDTIEDLGTFLGTTQSFLTTLQTDLSVDTTAAVATALSTVVTDVQTLETLVSGFSTSGASILSQLIASFGSSAESGLSGLGGLGGIFSDLIGFVGSPTGLGSGSPASAVAPTSVPALRGLFSGGTFLSSLIPNLNADIITAGTLSSSLIQGIEGTGTTLLGDVTNIVESAGATTAEGAGTLISDASGAISDATGIISGTAATAETDFGAAIGGAFGAILGLTGASASAASSSQLQSAAAAVAAAQAAQAQQTAAINAQLPKFYGGAGTSGLNAQVSLSGSLPSTFTNKGPLTATLSGTSTPGAQFAALFDMVADTDQQTVSRIDSTPIPVPSPPTSGTAVGPARYLQLRVNSGFTTYLQVKYWASATSEIKAIFNVELSCVVAGVKTVFDTFTSAAGGSVEADEIEADQLVQLSANNNISLEATADAITFTYPNSAASLSFTDSSGVSQIGSGFRQAGWGTDESPVVFPVSFAFFDSGPTSGPANVLVTTSASTTSETYADLPDTTEDQVTVNIGPNRLAIVFISGNNSNNTVAGQPIMTFAISGANTMAANDAYAIGNATAASASNHWEGAPFLLTPAQLPNQGATTFKLKYRQNGTSTATYANRQISVIPL